MTDRPVPDLTALCVVHYFVNVPRAIEGIEVVGVIIGQLIESLSYDVNDLCLWPYLE